MDKFSFIYASNNVIGRFIDDAYVAYSKDEKNSLYNKIEKLIIKKDRNRKLSSLIIGLSLLLCIVVLFVLMISNVINLGDGQWFNFIFIIALFILLWIIFYYIFGFIFYRKIHIDYYFKSKKTTNPNSALLYASSNYCKWVNSYTKYLGVVLFSNVNKKKSVVPFGLTKLSKFKNLIFNGKISSNIPYYYFSINNKKLLFLPAMVILVDGKNSKVMDIDSFKVIKKDNIYSFYNNDEIIDSIVCKNEFNINFFYFKYE